MKTHNLEDIATLADNEVFVFGSNLRGLHGAGAAHRAIMFGAVIGQGEGAQGQAYAIPTKNWELETLNLSSIRAHVATFIEYAKAHDDKTFIVTKIGCGLAGYKPSEIAPLFAEALEMDNVVLPREFALKIGCPCPKCGEPKYKYAPCKACGYKTYEGRAHA